MNTLVEEIQELTKKAVLDTMAGYELEEKKESLEDLMHYQVKH